MVKLKTNVMITLVTEFAVLSHLPYSVPLIGAQDESDLL